MTSDTFTTPVHTHIYTRMHIPHMHTQTQTYTHTKHMPHIYTTYYTYTTHTYKHTHTLHIPTHIHTLHIQYTYINTLHITHYTYIHTIHTYTLHNTYTHYRHTYGQISHKSYGKHNQHDAHGHSPIAQDTPPDVDIVHHQTTMETSSHLAWYSEHKMVLLTASSLPGQSLSP